MYEEDSPSNNNLLASTASRNSTHQLGHILVVVHVHCDLALRLGMGKGETRSDFKLCDSACRSRCRSVGMSYTEKRTNHSGGVRFSRRTTRMVVEDLSED